MLPRNKRYNVKVSFTVSRDIPNVWPAFVKGEPDSVWVTSPTKRKEDILRSAEHMLKLGYGLELLNPRIDHTMGFWH